MTAKTIARSAHVLTTSESWVLSALKGLPAEYEVQVNPRGLPDQYLSALRYEPDFVVIRPDGRKLIIEVKSPLSLSMSNMARLAHIGRAAQMHNDRFLVLVPVPPNRAESEFRPWGQEPLTLKFVADAGQVLSEVAKSFEPILGQSEG